MRNCTIFETFVIDENKYKCDISKTVLLRRNAKKSFYLTLQFVQTFNNYSNFNNTLNFCILNK